MHKVIIYNISNIKKCKSRKIIKKHEAACVNKELPKTKEEQTSYVMGADLANVD